MLSDENFRYMEITLNFSHFFTSLLKRYNIWRDNNKKEKKKKLKYINASNSNQSTMYA